MKAMILAAGEGTRLRPFTLALPKPAIPFLGVPLADYGLHLLEELGQCDLVVNVHHLAPEIRKLFQRPSLRNRQIDFSDETAGLLGSGGGIHKAEFFLKSEKNFVVVNGDEVILPRLTGQIRVAYDAHVASGRLATILVLEHPEVGSKFGGVWCEPGQNKVRQFSRTPVGGLKGWHYIGIIFFSNRVFSYFKPEVVDENILYETLTLGLQRGEDVSVHPIQAEWFETGNPSDFKSASTACLQAMQEKNPQDWARSLKEFLGHQSLMDPLIEKDDNAFVQQFENFKNSLKAKRP